VAQCRVAWKAQLCREILRGRFRGPNPLLVAPESEELVPVRVAIAVLVAVMARAFAGCGGDDEDGTTEARASPDTTAAATPTEPTLPPKPSPELVQALRRDANTWASLFAVRPATGTWASHSANEYARRFRSRSQMRRSRTSSTRAPCRSVRPPALSTERLSRSRMAWWSCSAGGGQRRCPPRLRAQDRVDHRVNRALGSSCRIAASSKPPPSNALRLAPLAPQRILRGRCRRRTRLGVRCRIEAEAAARPRLTVASQKRGK
jgi:hypothetical protein